MFANEAEFAAALREGRRFRTKESNSNVMYYDNKDGYPYRYKLSEGSTINQDMMGAWDYYDSVVELYSKVSTKKLYADKGVI